MTDGFKKFYFGLYLILTFQISVICCADEVPHRIQVNQVKTITKITKNNEMTRVTRVIRVNKVTRVRRMNIETRVTSMTRVVGIFAIMYLCK